ncbi:MAG TPA: DUF2303 family protein [Jatrophihabitantaceae bacterium]
MTELTALSSQSVTAEILRDAIDEARSRELLDLDPGGARLYGLVLAEGQRLEKVDVEAYEDSIAERPRAKTGHVTVDDAGSFVLYVDRHKDEFGTTLWADIDRGLVVAVFDDHEQTSDVPPDASAPSPSGRPGHGRHRATLTLKQTEDWAHWANADGKAMAQGVFAEHIEDGAHNVTDPDAATMLEIAQTLHAKTGIAFKSGVRLSSGQTQLQWEEETTAKAGVAGDLEVPTVFTLSLQPFEGSQVYDIEARFRYRPTQQGAVLSYKLKTPNQVKKLAFDDLTHEIAERLTLPVMAGKPRA